MKKIFICIILITTIFLIVSVSNFAAIENYPEEPIKVIIPFNPGGGSDILTRAVSKYIELDQPLVLIYVPGASGLIGAMELYREDPDGYTILAHNANAIVAQYLTGATDVMLWREFEIICDLVQDHTVVNTHPGTGWQSFDDLADFAKENPGKLRWGVTGARNINSVTMLMVQESIGTRFNMVPYDGGSATRAALLGKHIDVETTTVSDARGVIESGDVVPLAVLNDTRSPFLPDVPTLPELGYDVIAFQPRSYYAPPGTPKEIIDKLSAAFEKLSRNEEFIKEMEELYYVVSFSGPEEALKTAERMYDDWKPIFDTYFK